MEPYQTSLYVRLTIYTNRRRPVQTLAFSLTAYNALEKIKLQVEYVCACFLFFSSLHALHICYGHAGS